MCTWKELRRWYFTGKYPKTFLGSYFWRKSTKGASEKKTVLLEKMLWYDKRMGPLKTCVTQERGEGRLTKEVTKSDVGGGVAAKNSKQWCYSLKKTRFCEWWAFWMTPMMLTYFAVFFMSVFVDDVISFFWNK